MTMKIWTVSGFAAGALAHGCRAVEIAAIDENEAINRVGYLLSARGHASGGLSAKGVAQ
ncbi:hypothetical protein [Pararhizobium sp.]|uniref:hypothetical protein n=1 Tax=Pararhizobium sp. TaxID=1977563 RepID=UPI003D09C109